MKIESRLTLRAMPSRVYMNKLTGFEFKKTHTKGGCDSWTPFATSLQSHGVPSLVELHPTFCATMGA